MRATFFVFEADVDVCSGYDSVQDDLESIEDVSGRVVEDLSVLLYDPGLDDAKSQLVVSFAPLALSRRRRSKREREVNDNRSESDSDDDYMEKSAVEEKRRAPACARCGERCVEANVDHSGSSPLAASLGAAIGATHDLCRWHTGTFALKYEDWTVATGVNDMAVINPQYRDQPTMQRETVREWTCCGDRNRFGSGCVTGPHQPTGLDNAASIDQKLVAAFTTTQPWAAKEQRPARGPTAATAAAAKNPNQQRDPNAQAGLAAPNRNAHPNNANNQMDLGNIRPPAILMGDIQPVHIDDDDDDDDVENNNNDDDDDVVAIDRRQLLGNASRTAVVSLNPLLNAKKCFCLNEHPQHTLEQTLRAAGANYLCSDCDPELIITVGWTSIVKVQFIRIYTTNLYAAPATVKIYVNKSNEINFDSVGDYTPDQSFELTEDAYLEGSTAVLQLQVSKFTRVQTLTIYVSNNLGNEESTIIGRITFMGQAPNVR